MAGLGSRGIVRDVALVVAVPNEVNYKYNNNGQTVTPVVPFVSRLNDPNTGLPANNTAEVGPQANPQLRMDKLPNGKVSSVVPMSIENMEKIQSGPSQPWLNKNGEAIGTMYSVRADLQAGDTKNYTPHNYHIVGNSIKPGPELPDDPNAAIQSQVGIDRAMLDAMSAQRSQEYAEQQAAAKKTNSLSYDGPEM